MGDKGRHWSKWCIYETGAPRVVHGPHKLRGGKETFSPEALPALQIQTSSLQDCEGTHFCCFKPPACGNLSWQPQQTATTQGYSQTPLSSLKHKVPSLTDYKKNVYSQITQNAHTHTVFKSSPGFINAVRLFLKPYVTKK